MFKKFTPAFIILLSVVTFSNLVLFRQPSLKIAASPLVSKAGINDGLVINHGFEDTTIPFVKGQTSYATNFNMQYILELEVDKNDISGAVHFVNVSNSNGFIPIIRLCYPGNCNFASSADISNYFSVVSAQVNPGTTFIATLGPNEAGTGEMESFGLSHGNYTTLVNWANTAATALQSKRVANGGNMYLAPGIFNGSNSQPGSDDVKGYLYQSPTINSSLFDYLMVNEYDIIVAGVVYTSPYFYNESGRSVRQYVVSHPNLKTIISESGFSRNTPPLTYSGSYYNLCQDTTVNGILFFRPWDAAEVPPGYPTWGPRQDPAISQATLHSIINSCNALPVISCASYTYSEWSACTSGQHTRTVTTSFPNGCTGGATPDLTRTCTLEGSIICGSLDVDNNHLLNMVDFNNLSAKFGKFCSDTPTTNSCGPLDTNGDHAITISDFSYLASHFGMSC